MAKDIYDNASTYFAHNVWCEGSFSERLSSEFLDTAISKNNPNKKYFKLKDTVDYPIQPLGRDIQLINQINTTIRNTINAILSKVLENREFSKYQIIGKLQFYKNFSNDEQPFQYNDIILLPKYNEYVNL